MGAGGGNFNFHSGLMAGGLVGTGGAAQSTSTRLNRGGTGRRLVIVGGLGWQGVIGGWGRVLRVYIYNIRSRLGKL
jgi:hypothetical protein